MGQFSGGHFPGEQISGVNFPGGTFPGGIFPGGIFHAVKESHARLTSRDVCLLFIILLICLFPFCFDFILFNEALLVYSYVYKFYKG